MINYLNKDWRIVLEKELQKEYFLTLSDFIENEYATKIVYPSKSMIFNGLNLCSFANTKVIILGQDPYHGQDQAHGLSFSVSNGVKHPPSLKNIFKELYTDVSILPPINGNLETWAAQGVLLLNASLTVVSKLPNSHQKAGWEQFTDAIISQLSEKRDNLVFMLWGAFAQNKITLIDQNKHLVLSTAHPSPFSAHKGFFGSKPFSKTNEHLESKGIETILWGRY